MAAVDPRLVRALREQLDRRDALLRQGAERIGWKLGLSERDSIGGEIGVGNLTSATVVASGDHYVPADREAGLRADAEIVVEVSRDVDPADSPATVREAIAAYGVALEICDVSPLPNEPHSVIATNDFHRAVAFGALEPTLPADADAELVVNGTVRASGQPPRDIPQRLAAAARVLAAVDERVRAGDRLITGLIVQVPVALGDDVVARLGAVAAAQLRVSTQPRSRS